MAISTQHAKKIQHALMLNLHQPHGNLEQLLIEKPWEARDILYAYDSISRSLWPHEDIAKIHLTLSGSLLKTLSSPSFQESVYGIVDCGSLLWHLQNERIIHILGTAFYHPILPLIPETDWEAQIHRWQLMGRQLFQRETFQGFWPPELGFSMEMIPYLVRQGYRYVVVDSEHIVPLTAMNDADRCYRPHWARFNGASIIVIPRDRSLSESLAAGMNYRDFEQEVIAKTLSCTQTPLVLTACDAENGAWFRNSNAEDNFWGGFYASLLVTARASGPIQPVHLHDALDQEDLLGEVEVTSGAWNVDANDQSGFGRWTATPAQQSTLDRLKRVSHALHLALQEGGLREMGGQEIDALEDAHDHLLRAETSCNFYWGDDWVARAHRDLDATETTLHKFCAKKYLIDADPGWFIGA